MVCHVLVLTMLDITPTHHHHLPYYHPQDFYSKQQPYHHLAVIELVEVAPPTPRNVIDSPSSYFSSSAGSEDSDDDEDDESEMDDPIESYCSSELDKDGDHPTPLTIPRTDSFQRSMKRILLWRERSNHCGLSFFSLNHPFSMN